MRPDMGERHLSTPLFGDVPAETTDEERALLQWTPTFAEAGVAAPGAPLTPAAVPHR